jgi:hypothetical protein
MIILLLRALVRNFVERKLRFVIREAKSSTTPHIRIEFITISMLSTIEQSQLEKQRLRIDWEKVDLIGKNPSNWRNILPVL